MCTTVRGAGPVGAHIDELPRGRIAGGIDGTCDRLIGKPADHKQREHRQGAENSSPLPSSLHGRGDEPNTYSPDDVNATRALKGLLGVTRDDT